MATFPSKPWSDGQTYEVIPGQTFIYNGASASWEYVTNLTVDSDNTQNLSVIETRIDSDGQRITVVKGAVTEISDNVSTVESRLDSDENEIQAIKTILNLQLGDINTRLDSDNALIQSIRNDITILETNLDSDVANIKDLRRDADSDSAALQVLSIEAASNAASIQTTLSMLDSDGTVLQDLRTSLDAIDGKVLSSNTYYVNTGLNTIQSVVDEIGTSKGKQIQLSAGSHSGGVTTTDMQNCVFTGPTAPRDSSVSEILGVVSITGSSSTRVRFVDVQFDSESTITGTQGRHYFQRVTFQQKHTISANTNWLVYTDCSFDNGLEVDASFAGVVYLINCSFNNINPVFNQASDLQVIITDGTGFNTSYPTNATLAGSNALSSGSVRSSLNELIVNGTSIDFADIESRLDSDSSKIQSLQEQIDQLNIQSGVTEADHDSDLAQINSDVDSLPIPVISSTQPSGQTGQLWINLNDGRLYYWHTSDEAWTEIVTGA